MSDFNAPIIEEFRANGGKVSGQFEGQPLLLLHTVGAKSGQPRVNPMMYLREGDAYLVFGSYGGAPKHPDWYHNLMAHPETEIEVGTERVRVRGREAQGEERERIWAKTVADHPVFAKYEAKSGRQTPVLLLEPIG